MSGMGVSSPNEDVNSMTLLQLLQSFPDPPTTVTIDPSLVAIPPKNIRASILFPPISAPSLVTNDGYTSISPIITSSITSSPQPSPPRANSSSTPPFPTFQPITLTNSSPNLLSSPSSSSSSPASPLSHSSSNLPPLSPPLSNVNTSPSHLSSSTSSIPKTNGYSPPLHGYNSNLSGFRASAPVFKSTSPSDTIDLVTRG